MTSSPNSRSSIVRRFWKPVAATGAGGTAVVLWFEEMMLFVQDILALIFLPILAGVIYLLDIFMFKSRMPRREDLTTPTHGGKE
jgi:hypothetical protein